ncbi:MAG: phosphatidate cytidylyltransferase, partial [Elusimicrobia bacterium]|nr:phosphatidate cytidylyltransferase [Elusimicrobiota bacterium]
ILAMGGRPVQRWVLLLCGGALSLSVALGGPSQAVLCAATAAILLREMFSRVRSLERLAFTVLGALLLGWMPAHLALIRDLRPDGQKLTYMLFIAVWLTDTAAYAAGRAFGRHKLAEGLSPKKTWEGAAAGFLFAVGSVYLLQRLLAPAGLGPRGALALGALIGLCGQLSDLAESLVKRAVGAKDSGDLLPGHGGVMDRFDSFILAAPAAYYFLLYK